MARILIVGPGRVGTALALCLKSFGHHINGAVGRTKESLSCRRFANLVGTSITHFHDTLAFSSMISKSDIIFLTVHDTDIELTARQMAHEFSFHNLQLVCHTAGALGIDTLCSLSKAGAMIGCLHPLQTFADPLVSSKQLPHSHFAVTGNQQVTAILEKLIAGLGATSFILKDEDRAVYHTAASIASNMLIALIDTAAKIMPINDGLGALLPLIEGTVANLKHIGLPNALTGPIERGDIGTVLSHLRALANNENANSVYRVLGKATVSVASEKDSLNEEVKARLLRILEETPKEG